MATLPLAMGGALAGGRVFAATSSKGQTTSSKGKEEKSFVDWILAGLTKQEQFYEVDPIMNKVEEKSSGNGTASTGARKGTVSIPAPKKKNGGGGLGGLGGLFAKK